MLKAIRKLLPDQREPETAELTVIRPKTRAAVTWDPRPHGHPTVPPTVWGHFVAAVKKRAHMAIDGKTAARAVPILKNMTEQARLATDYQNSLNSLMIAEAEREVRLLELEQRKADLSAQRLQQQELHRLRLDRDRLQVELEVARLKKDIREAKARPQKASVPSPAQKRLIKRAELQERLSQLRLDEEAAVSGARNEIEKRRYQNMYNQRRERILEELENYL